MEKIQAFCFAYCSYLSCELCHHSCLSFLFLLSFSFFFSLYFDQWSKVKLQMSCLLRHYFQGNAVLGRQPKDCHPSLRFKEEREKVPWHSRNSWLLCFIFSIPLEIDKLRSDGTAAHFASPSVHLFAHRTSSSHLNKTKVNHRPWDTLFYKLRQNVWETSDFEFCLSVVYLPFCLPLHLLLLCYIRLSFPCQHCEYIVCFTCVSLALWCVLSHGPQPPHPVIIVFLLSSSLEFPFVRMTFS